MHTEDSFSHLRFVWYAFKSCFAVLLARFFVNFCPGSYVMTVYSGNCWLYSWTKYISAISNNVISDLERSEPGGYRHFLRIARIRKIVGFRPIVYCRVLYVLAKIVGSCGISELISLEYK